MMKTKSWLLAIGWAMIGCTAYGQLTTIYNFTNGGPTRPKGALLLSGSTLYGMTTYGSSTMGAVFALPTAGGDLTWSTGFGEPPDAGDTPYGSLILSGSTLYGMTYQGGVSNMGMIFSVPASGGTPTTLYTFDGSAGANPYGSLMLSGSTLYGMTSAGGTANEGTIFSIPLSGGSPAVLYNFDLTNNAFSGRYPHGSLIASADGTTLYGLTSSGGNPGGGTAFAMPITGGAPTALANFYSTWIGSTPLGTLSLSPDGSTLYGMTSEGGAAVVDGSWIYPQGTIFSININNATNNPGNPPEPTILHYLLQNEGFYPKGSLTLSHDGSTVYGLTSQGGAYDYGTIFAMNVDGTGFTNLWTFTGGADGGQPYGDLTLSADGSTLFGTTSMGGTDSNGGTIFALTLNAIPEPTSVGILALAGAVFGGIRRYRRIVHSSAKHHA